MPALLSQFAANSNTQDSSISQLPRVQLLERFGNSSLIHLELLDQRLDIMVGGKGKHFRVRCSRRNEIGHKVVAVEEVWNEPFLGKYKGSSLSSMIDLVKTYGT